MGKSWAFEVKVPKILISAAAFAQKAVSFKVSVWTVLTIIFTIALLSWISSFEIALVLLSGALIHELGHAWAFKKQGLKVKGIYISPLGLITIARGNTKSHTMLATVAIAGPATGIVFSVICILVWGLTKNVFWVDAASWVVLLNLLNLLPIRSMDGDKVVQSILRSTESKSVAIAVAGSFFFLGVSLGLFLRASGLMLLVLLSAHDVIWKYKKQPKPNTNSHRYPYKRSPPLPVGTALMTRKEVAAGVVTYVSLIGAGIALLVISNMIDGVEDFLAILLN